MKLIYCISSFVHFCLLVTRTVIFSQDFDSGMEIFPALVFKEGRHYAVPKQFNLI